MYPTPIDSVRPLELHAGSLDEATKIAHSSSDFTYTSNLWFLDIKDRFRVFKYDGIAYISKKTKNQKALDELKKSKEAHNRVNKVEVGSKVLNVIVPRLIYNDEKSTYVVSEFFGDDLNQLLYKGIRPLLTIDECIGILSFLLEKGVSHPGYLPRNMIEKNNELFFFDWEDATFSADGAVAFNRLWYTNFILNWSYLFTKSNLDQNLLKTIDAGTLSEPPLVAYEKSFKNLVNLKTNDITNLRNTIENVVFGAELPTKPNVYERSILPNDLGHLFADIFHDEIDVFADMATKVLRSTDDIIYVEINKIVSDLIREAFDVDRKNMQWYVILGLLLLMDPGMQNSRAYTLLKKDASLPQIIAELYNISNDCITAKFLKKELRQKHLDPLVHSIIISAAGREALTAEPPKIREIIKFFIEAQESSP